MLHLQFNQLVYLVFFCFFRIKCYKDISSVKIKYIHVGRIGMDLHRKFKLLYKFISL